MGVPKEGMVDRRLIEMPERAVESQMQLALTGGEKFRLTARGAYHIRKWLPTLSYLDAMVFDTRIFDDSARDEILQDLESFDIRVRLSLIVRWSKALPIQSTAELLSTPFGNALSALLAAYQSVSTNVTSTTAARYALLSAISKGAAIDHIAVAFLDRAIDNKEFAWSREGAVRVAELDDESN
jgi:hypothetical protein